MTLNEIMGGIESAWAEMKKLVDAANASGEPMSGETQERYFKIEKEIEKLSELRDQNTRHLAKLEEFRTKNKPVREAPFTSEIAGLEDRARSGGSVITNDDAGYVDGEDDPTPANWKRAGTKQYNRAFRNWMKNPNAVKQHELRILNETTNADGGFLPATEFYGKLVQTRQLSNFLRQISTVITLSGKTGNVTFESSIGTPAYEAESVTTTNTDAQFSNLTIAIKKMVYLAKITEELSMDDRFDTTGWLSSMIGRAMGQYELQGMLKAVSGGPTGLAAIVTSGNSNLVTTASSGVLVPDELIDVVYTVPWQYRQNACWVVHDTLAKALRKLVVKTAGVTSTQSSIAATPYLWEPSFQAGAPDRLLGFPMYTTNVGLDAFAASNKKVALFGDFSYHIIADRDNLSIRFLDQAFIASGQFGYRAVARHDAGWTVLPAICGLQIL